MFSYISLNWRGRIAAIPIQRTICRRGGKMTLSAMTMALEIPDEAVLSVLRALPSPSRALLEGFAVEGQRSGTLSAKEVRVLLGHESRWETEDFLAAHEAWPGLTAEEVAEDGRALAQLLRP